MTEKIVKQAPNSYCEVIGKGLIGLAFEEKPSLHLDSAAIIFASGVSNSLETNPQPYLREKKLLESVIKKKTDTDKFVYFSTLSIYDEQKQNSAYIQHKLELEKFIQQECQNHLILRVPNIVGFGGNPTTLLNYLITSVMEGREIKIFQNAYRNFIDVGDLVVLVKALLASQNNATINLLHPVSYSMLEVMKYIELYTGKASKSIYIEQGNNYFPLLNEQVKTTFEQNNIDTSKNYLNQILRKYY
ncbi:NAD-dependent epimerase/dehydratase family protein [Bernardetia sp.]|uniref:NAD-dependent epimerase/dehydratase family protein n=1 Tax=Bernardetia sp. TaxID=1937974 RepID=UPI0025C6F469|nr:NAD(P)-dependent oxidoreductase [Bernardetia sp.]